MDGDSPAVRSDPQLRAHLSDLLARTPAPFRKPQNVFNPLPHVVAALSSYSSTGIAGKSADFGEEIRALALEADLAAAKAVDCFSSGFGRSIANYSSILRHVQSSQNAVQQLRKDLNSARGFLAGEEVSSVSSSNSTPSFSGDNKGLLVGESVTTTTASAAERRRVIEVLWRQHLEYEAMLEMYSKIEKVTHAPTILEERIARRHYLHAARCVASAVEDLYSEDLVGIVALTTLQRHLMERKHALRDLILEEIVEFVYREPASSLRARHRRDAVQRVLRDSSDSSDGESGSSESEDDDDGDDDDESSSSTFEYQSTELSDLSGTEPGAKDASRPRGSRSSALVDVPVENTQAKVRQRSRHFLQILIESMNTVERVPLAVMIDRLLSNVRPRMQRMSTALHHAARDLFERENQQHNQVLRWGASDRERMQLALSQLCILLFERALAILQQHCVWAHIAARRFDDAHSKHEIVTCLFSVWSVMQQELERILCAHLDFDEALLLRGKSKSSRELGADVVAAGAGSADAVLTARRAARLFSFAGSSAATFFSTEDTRAAATPTGSANFILPSPYNVVVLYAEAQSLDTRARAVLGRSRLLLDSSETDKRSHDREHKESKHRLDLNTAVSFGTFLDAFALQSFLPKVKVDYRKRIEAAIAHVDAWRTLSGPGAYLNPLRSGTMPSDGQGLGKISIVLEVGKALDDLVDIHARLNGRHTAYILAIMCSAAERFAVAVRMKLFADLLKETLCSERLADNAYFKLLQQDPLFWNARVQLCGATDSEREVHQHDASDDVQNDAFIEIEYSHEKAQNWFGANAHIFKHQMIGGADDRNEHDVVSVTNTTSALSLLATLAHSCGWLATEIDRVLIALNLHQQRFANRDATSHEDRRASFSKKKQSKHVSYLGRTAEKVRQLAEHALLALRVEIRIRCQYYLDGVREARYALLESDGDDELADSTTVPASKTLAAPLPDPFVVELNTELSTISEALAPFLTPTQQRYLWDGVPSLIGHLLSIHALNKMPRRDAVDRLGAAKMCRNISTLQQQLTNIGPHWFREGPLDRVRRFYTLLGESQTADALLSRIAQHVSTAGPQALSMDEYRALLEYKHKDGRLPDREARLLRELHAKRNLHTPRR